MVLEPTAAKPQETESRDTAKPQLRQSRDCQGTLPPGQGELAAGRLLCVRGLHHTASDMESLGLARIQGPGCAGAPPRSPCPGPPHEWGWKGSSRMTRPASSPPRGTAHSSRGTPHPPASSSHPAAAAHLLRSGSSSCCPSRTAGPGRAPTCLQAVRPRARAAGGGRPGRLRGRRVGKEEEEEEEAVGESARRWVSSSCSHCVCRSVAVAPQLWLMAVASVGAHGYSECGYRSVAVAPELWLNAHG